MTYPRRNLFEPGQAGAYHCVSRCVRRAWLCGVDSYSGKSFEHRKPIVEARIHQLGEIFAVGIHAYAVMSNHVHLVLSESADTHALAVRLALQEAAKPAYSPPACGERPSSP